VDDQEAVEKLGPVFIDSYFVVDRDRRILNHNGTFTQMLELRGADRRKAKGSPCYDLLRLEICQNGCIALQCMEKNAPVRMNEIRGRTKDGRELVLELSAMPIRDANGQTTGVLVTHRDVTDERRLKERYLEEETEHKKERLGLLRVIEERDVEIEKLQQRLNQQSRRKSQI
jgi:PAS domain S-box-containing protein